MSTINTFSQHLTSDDNHKNNPYYSHTDTHHLTVSNAEWKKILPPDLYAVAREQATERAFTGKYWDSEAKGTYYCAVCGNILFKKDHVLYRPDNSYGMHRTEVTCGRCDSHLGHVFDDGPVPTHKRFCMNSVSLEFNPDALTAKKP